MKRIVTIIFVLISTVSFSAKSNNSNALNLTIEKVEIKQDKKVERIKKKIKKKKPNITVKLLGLFIGLAFLFKLTLLLIILV